jgi:transposase
MLTPPAGVKVLVATRPVDFRKGADGLAALAKEALGQDPLSGIALVFRAKRADRVKVLVWDGSGLVLYWKRLENGAFKWPPIVDGVMRMNAAQLAALLSAGILVALNYLFVAVFSPHCPASDTKNNNLRRNCRSPATEFASFRGDQRCNFATSRKCLLRMQCL